MIEPMLNILCKHSFSDFAEIPQSFFPSLLKVTSKSTHFLPAEKKISILWIELQTNTKGLKTLHLNTER